jgi:NAD(P)-dependent dehydrogenase (short-subunit alcohol dehydrogenase family)
MRHGYRELDGEARPREPLSFCGVSGGVVLIVGGTSGIGLRLAERCAAAGERVVITGRDGGRAGVVAAGIRGEVSGLGLDLAVPAEIGGRLASVGGVSRLVLAAVERDANTVRGYDVAAAVRLVTLKLVGYSEVVHVLIDRLAEDASVVLFGGLAWRRPYPGSTTVSTVNGGVSGLVATLAVELAPVRVNALHPGVVGDSPEWVGKAAGVLEGLVARTPTGRLARMDDVVGAALFLLENPAVNGVNLEVDGGWLLC